MLFAATYPERTSNLVLWGAYASMIRRSGYDWGLSQEQIDGAANAYHDRWGTGVGLSAFVPSRARDDATRRWWGRFQRMAASPAAAVALLKMNAQIDVRGALSAISAPTLIVHRRDDVIAPLGGARYLAEHIRESQLAVFDGADHWPWFGGNLDEIVAEIEEFLTGARGAPEPERVLATVLFTDIVGSTERAVEVGDSRWRELLERHNAMVRAELARHRGREIKTVGDGFLATFDGPARAIRCAGAILEEARTLGLQVRAGIHTGECELIGEDIGGLGVHIGARVAALAEPSEVLVSRTVTDLVAGSGIEFQPRGLRQLKGIPGEWALFSVA
jgi:class 3 adenylate cyclase